LEAHLMENFEVMSAIRPHHVMVCPIDSRPYVLRRFDVIDRAFFIDEHTRKWQIECPVCLLTHDVEECQLCEK
jgi:hypothetical protein